MLCTLSVEHIHNLMFTKPENLDLSKLKDFADDINVPQILKSVYGKVANIVGKGDNSDNQHFLLFP